MADRIELAELNISFTGGTEDLQKGAQQAKAVVTASFNKITDSGGKVEQSTEKIDKSFKKLDTSAVNLSARINLMERAYDQFKNVAQQGLALAQLGAQSERVEDRFQKFAATIGSSKELLEAFNRGSAGAVDQMTAMNSAALLVQQGLVTDNAEMEKTVEMATRLGDQTLGATSRLEFFSQLLKNQSIRLLDNFGISSGRVRTRIKELQDATAGLSREEAFRIATFEEGQKALDVLGERLDDNALKFEQATAKMQDMRVEMGEMLAPAGAKLMEIIASLNNSTLALIVTLTGAVAVAAKFSGGLSPMIEKLGLTGKQFGALAIGIGLAIAAYEVIRDLQKEVAEGQKAAAEATQSWAEEMANSIDDGMKLGDAIGELADRVNIADEALHANGNILEDMATGLVRATSETKIMGEAADEVKDIIIKQSESLEEANGLIDTYNKRVGNAEAKLDRLTAAQWASIESTTILSGSQSALNAALDIFGLEMPNLTDALNKQTLAQERVTEANRLWLEQAAEVQQAADLASLAARKRQEDNERHTRVQQRINELERDRVKRLKETADAAAKLAEQVVKEAEKEARAIEIAQAKAERAQEKAERAREKIRKARRDAFKAKQAEAEAEAAAIRKVIELQNDALNVQIRRAEQLKDATAEQVAGVAISELEKAQKAGLISFDEYAEAVVEIQDRFGLADDSSRALTLGLATLVDEFIDGNVAASEFDDILESLIKNAGILNDQFEEVEVKVNKPLQIVKAGSQAYYESEEYAQRQSAVSQATSNVESSETRREPGKPTGGGVTIYGDIKLEGVEDAEDFLRQLMSLME